MNKQLILIGLALLSIASLVSSCCNGDECNCEPNCWEKCFMNPTRYSSDPFNTRDYKNAFMEIYRMAIGIRNLYAPCFKPHGTAYMMDADVPASGSSSAIYAYQRQLAAIVAMVQPVGDNCNPFCASKFHRNFAWYSHSWPCKNRCEAYRFFTSNPGMTSFSQNQIWQQQPSWVGGGEILSRLCFNRPHLNGHECMNCTKNELLIAFTNSPMFPAPSSVCGGNPYHCAAVGVSPATHANMDLWAKTGPAYHLPSTQAHRYAASRISRCMFTHCCRYVTRNTWWLPTRRVSGRAVDAEEETETELDLAEEEFDRQKNNDQVFEFLDPKSNGRTRTFKGSQKEFDVKILGPSVNGDVTQVGGGKVSPIRG